MKRRTFLKHLGAAGALTFFSSCRPKPRPTNIVLFLTDDQGWGDLSAQGNTILNTPNMDRIASEGVSFERFFVSPVCAPTRAALLTGRYPLRSGVHGVTRGEETMRSEELTLAEILRQADPEGTPIPLLFSGVTDSRFFRRLGIQTYGFTPMQLPPSITAWELGHGPDERVPVSAMQFGTDAIYEALKRYRAE
ncbi:MAG: twin-arginine translocation signal domain-containing protein [Calditrichaeota bacterium]|nr:MAG: twin-arginine translocation signal domain-containing protein [Calditrichota bacterium]